MLHFCICQVAHDIDIVCGKIERDTYIANARGERTKPASMQMKHLPKFTRYEVLPHCNNSRIKAFNMPHCQLDTTHTRQLNERKRFFNGARHGFFDQHIDTLVEYIGCYFKMQVGKQ